LDFKEGRAETIFKVAGLALAYFLSARLGLRLALINSSATAVWPPTGIALAALLLGGKRLWPAIFVGAFAANLVIQWSLSSSLFIATGNTAEAVVGAWLVRRFAGGKHVFEQPISILRFVCFAALPSTCFSATIGVGSLLFFGGAEWTHAGAIWTTWGLGDLGGDLIVAPLVLLWAQADPAPPQPARWKEFCLAMGSLLLSALLAFQEGPLGLQRQYPLIFLCFPPLLWLALRFSQRISIAAIAVLSAIAVQATLAGQGPFYPWNTNESLVLLQAYLGISCIMSLSLGAAILQYRLSEAALQQTQDKLKMQHAELLRSNSDLEQFAYAASHDLKAPLRAVSNLSHWLAEDLKERLQPQDREHFQLMEQRVTRMNRMLEDLLLYARADLPEEPRRLEALESVLNDAWDSLGSPPTFKLEFHGLSSDRVPAATFRRILLNLLNNAVKHHDRGGGVIAVSATASAAELELSVLDDGPGISLHDRERAFQMFQTLRPRDEVEGTGIGLALVKKLVDQQGGRIWIAGPAGRGSDFRVMWPFRRREA
jgi:signal transduction histidine kinase